MRRLFVTGTDTGVGKTFVTAALARRARAHGMKVFAFKPIETGCEAVRGRRVGADQELISAAAGDWQTGDERGVYRLLQPAAPLVAAQAEGVAIDMARLTAVASSVADADLLLVEGAGGWRVPITETEDMSSLAQRVGAEVVIVGRAGLGTINHTLLTIEAVERDGLSIAAVVLSRRPEDDRDFTLSNRDEIGRRWPGRILIVAANPVELDPLLGVA
jgi:dethiobiotin synthetase